jgi:predicted signal transduction protein with EAL and GGDEF domain
VTGVVDNTDSAAIVRAITMLGEELDLPITAEGIETDAVLERLREYGQISGQGYLYGYPQPAEVTLEWLDGIGLAVAERTSPGGGSSDARIEVESLLARRGHRKFPSERRRTAER